MTVLVAHDLLPANLPDVQLWAAGDRRIVASWGPADQRETKTIVLTDALRTELKGKIANIDRIGLALFESHPLGIELAGVILLLAMVGAIVIGRKRVLSELDTGAYTHR